MVDLTGHLLEKFNENLLLALEPKRSALVFLAGRARGLTETSYHAQKKSFRGCDRRSGGREIGLQCIRRHRLPGQFRWHTHEGMIFRTKRASPSFMKTIGTGVRTRNSPFVSTRVAGIGEVENGSDGNLYYALVLDWRPPFGGLLFKGHELNSVISNAFSFRHRDSRTGSRSSTSPPPAPWRRLTGRRGP